MTLKIITLTIMGLTLFGISNAYANHTNNNIWIETAEGQFTPKNDSMEWEFNNTEYTYNGKTCVYDIDRPQITRVNGVQMFESVGGCGDRMEERVYFLGNQSNDIDMTLQKYHECVCGYWYDNRLKSEYTFTIIDLPNHIESPPDYNNVVMTGVRAGLESWGDINQVNFRPINDRLTADIIIQQGEGKGIVLANTEPGCLFNNDQCTIQLFTLHDIDKRLENAYISEEIIKWLIAHEFGHLIGLPHHTDLNSIMYTATEQTFDMTDYEIYGIDVPNMKKPTDIDIIYESEQDKVTSTVETIVGLGILGAIIIIITFITIKITRKIRKRIQKHKIGPPY